MSSILGYFLMSGREQLPRNSIDKRGKKKGEEILIDYSLIFGSRPGMWIRFASFWYAAGMISMISSLGNLSFGMSLVLQCIR